MASTSIGMEVRTAEYRPCMVGGQRALFHRWEHKSEVVSPGIAIGSHPGGVVACDMAIVEFEDGSVSEVFPYRIKFIPGIFEKYCFDEVSTDGK